MKESEFKGTKGDWYIEDKREINEFGSHGTDISSFYQRQFITIWGIDDKDKEAESNAKLIAAAPELLEALIPFASFPDEDFIEKESEEFFTMTVQIKHIIAAKKAIQKALKIKSL